MDASGEVTSASEKHFHSNAHLIFENMTLSHCEMFDGHLIGSGCWKVRVLQASEM